MSAVTASLEPTADPMPDQLHSDQDPDFESRRRFTKAVSLTLGVLTLPYLWILTDLWAANPNLFRLSTEGNFYDLQARSLLGGHLSVPNGSLGVEGFIHGGREYTYFGIFPSLLRMPVLIVTHSLDGRLTVVSMLLAWLVTGTFTSLLLWRVRVLVRGNAVLGRAEAATCALLVGAITGGSVLMYLAATPTVFEEELAWSVALTIGVVFALLGVAEHPTWPRVVVAGVLTWAAALDRGSTGYACVLAVFLLAAWFAFGRATRGSGGLGWAVALAAFGAAALGTAMTLNLVKFGTAIGFSEAEQVWTQVNAHRRSFLAANGGSAFGTQFLPSTLLAYLQPAGVHLSSLFPFVSLPSTPARAVGHVVLDETYPTASIPASMPLLFLLGGWGLVAAVRPGRIRRSVALPLLLVATGAGALGVLLFGYIADRYLADFLPFLALAAMVGMLDVWCRLDKRARNVRALFLAAIAALAVFGVWANVGAAISPSMGWTKAQAHAFVSTRRTLSAGSLAAGVVHARVLPGSAPEGTLYDIGNCSGLYISTGVDNSNVPAWQVEHASWIAVEQGPGIVQGLRLQFERTVTRGDAPAVLMTRGNTRLVLSPAGVNQVRLELLDAAPPVQWPPPVTGPIQAGPRTPLVITVTVDPHLDSISVTGGGSTQLLGDYVAGPGVTIFHAAPDLTGWLRVLPEHQATSTRLCRSLASTVRR